MVDGSGDFVDFGDGEGDGELLLVHGLGGGLDCAPKACRGFPVGAFPGLGWEVAVFVEPEGEFVKGVQVIGDPVAVPGGMFWVFGQ